MPGLPRRRPAIDIEALADWAEGELREAGTPKRAASEQAYLKSSLEHAGASVPAVRAVAKRIRRSYPDVDAVEALALAQELWAVPLHECRLLAVVILETFASALYPTELARLEAFLRDSRTWAFVDGLAGHVAADIVLRYPDDPCVHATLRDWGEDPDFWVRRSALLAHLGVVGRRGEFQGWDRFCELADAMLDEREFFIRKAIGWVLREASNRRPDLVVEFVAPRTSRISGVTIREAVRHLETSDREALMTAYRDGTTRRRSTTGRSGHTRT